MENKDYVGKIIGYGKNGPYTIKDWEDDFKYKNFRITGCDKESSGLEVFTITFRKDEGAENDGEIKMSCSILLRRISTHTYELRDELLLKGKPVKKRKKKQVNLFSFDNL
jgi:hypothetical protein